MTVACMLPSCSIDDDARVVGERGESLTLATGGQVTTWVSSLANLPTCVAPVASTTFSASIV